MEFETIIQLAGIFFMGVISAEYLWKPMIDEKLKKMVEEDELRELMLKKFRKEQLKE